MHHVHMIECGDVHNDGNLPTHCHTIKFSTTHKLGRPEVCSFKERFPFFPCEEHWCALIRTWNCLIYLPLP